jgi:uncharacterized protein YyaL (SSP411 family)
MISLQEVSGRWDLIREAGRITEMVLSQFGEEAGPFFYYTPECQKDIIVRKKEVYDGAVPSGNAIMAWNLHRLGILLNQPAWRQRSTDMLEAIQQTAVRYPNSFGVWVNFLLELVQGTREIVALGPAAGEGVRELLQNYLPHRVLQFGPRASEGFPLTEGKEPIGPVTYFLCRDYACQKPVKTVPELMQLID